MTNAVTTVGIAGGVSFLAWLLVIWKLDPFESTGLGLTLFFLSLLAFLVSGFTLLGFIVRRYLNQGEISFTHFNVSLRQGILLAFLSGVALAFLMLGVLRIWNAALLIVIVLLIELYFESRSA